MRRGSKKLYRPLTDEMNINGHVCRTVFYWETLGPVVDFFNL